MNLNGVLIPNLLNNPITSLFSMNLDFFLSQTVQFDTSISLFCLVLVTLRFLFGVFLLQMTQYALIVFI